MPVTRVSRTVPAVPDVVWPVVSDPWHQPRWWPRVRRVEGVADGRWTQVLATQSGKGIRADFQMLETEAPRRLRWEQELAGSPFERFLEQAVTTIELAPAGAGTRVSIELRQQLLGWSRLAPWLFRRAARRQLGEALEGLERALAGGG
jgi:uncharacterized protein YndB with AHSA1/START domain